MASDPATGRPLPESAVQRVVFVASNVHVYGIPPITSTRGFTAASWTAPPRPTAQQIFTARLRIIETSVDAKLKADVVLEDGNTGELFAAAPYTSTAAVQQAEDSSRFFAVRVVGEGGMKATLGIGFEERGPALDFNIALGDMRKVLGWEQRPSGSSTMQEYANKDFSLKEGEKIQIRVGLKGPKSSEDAGSSAVNEQSNSAALFSIAPPPNTAKSQSLAPSIHTVAANTTKSAGELGFDDGEFGEFQ